MAFYVSPSSSMLASCLARTVIGLMHVVTITVYKCVAEFVCLENTVSLMLPIKCSYYNLATHLPLSSLNLGVCWGMLYMYNVGQKKTTLSYYLHVDQFSGIFFSVKLQSKFFSDYA